MYISIETYRGFVYPSVTDHMGHMNVQSYTGRFDEATWQFLAHLGLTPSFLKCNDRGAVAVDQHTQYKREVLAGSLLHVRTELTALGRTSIRFVHHMFDSETNEEVATTELVGVYFDTAIRASTPLPASVHRRARTLRVDPVTASNDGTTTEEMIAV
jgi:acyl-CoA thioester hydrolase